jgi:O-acetyl-ADP-ribose deacetylase (regulator of RNase III)
MTEYYVAFSIAGSNAFITANKTTEAVQESGKKIIIDGFTFGKGTSRTSSLRGATKLLSADLEDKNRKPTKDPAVVLAFFDKLKEAGWDVDDRSFIARHKLKRPQKVTPVEKVPVETKVDFQPDTPPAVDVVAAKMASAADTMPETPAPGSVDDGSYESNEAEKVIAQEKPAFERLDGSIKAIQGDITTVEADAIINAANAELIPGGGVDGAINRAAGPELADAMRSFGGTVTGNAVITDAFGLQTTKHIIHAVGPIYSDYTVTKAADLLSDAYHSAFSLARVYGCKTVAAPLLSTGVYGYPMDRACAIAVQTAKAFNTESGEDALDITFVAFDDAAFAILMNEVGKVNQG